MTDLDETQSGFGARLHALMDQEGLNLNSLAHRVGIPYNTLKHTLTTPGAVLSIDHLSKLPQHFPHWSLAYILAGREPMIQEQEPPPTPTPITPLAQITDWLGVREQIKQDLARITGDAWAVYAGTVQDHTHKLLEENEALHAWLAAQGEKTQDR